MQVLQRIFALAKLSALELYRRKDVYTALILGVAIMLPLASVNLFGVEGILRYLSEVSLLLVWIFSIVIAISTAARQVPLELERRTVYPLLARPVRRTEVILGKYAGALLASGSSLVLFYLLFAVLSGVKQGDWVSATYVQAFFLHFCFLMILVAMVICGSLLFSRSANTALCGFISVGMLLFGTRLPELAAGSHAAAGWFLDTVHVVAPHFEFFDLRLRVVHGWEALPWGVVAVLGLYAVCYSAAFLGGACLLFKRKAL